MTVNSQGYAAWKCRSGTLWRFQHPHILFFSTTLVTTVCCTIVVSVVVYIYYFYTSSLQFYYVNTLIMRTTDSIQVFSFVFLICDVLHFLFDAYMPMTSVSNYFSSSISFWLNLPYPNTKTFSKCKKKSTFANRYLLPFRLVSSSPFVF